MASFQLLLLLAALLSHSAGLPLDSKKTKRDSPSHQIVQVPPPSSVSEATTQHLARTNNFGTHRPEFTVQITHSPDHNDISQSNSKHDTKSSDHPKKKSGTSRKNPKKGRKSNLELLNHLGMTKLRSPTINHHRKRLASQSRKTHHQKSSSDSKMFVIKLPPNPYYYAHHDLNGFDVLEPQPKSVNNVPVNFNTNGKPSRVYHWNIPVLKKMVARKAGSSKTAVFADSEIFNIDKQVTWNDTDDEKAIYRKATYYGPKKQSKHTFRKYFAGNGKPHSFYVMEKNKKPAYVHRLLP